jgi:predicted peptidase
MATTTITRKTTRAGLHGIIFQTAFVALITGQLMASYRIPTGVTISGIAAPAAGHQVVQKIIASGDTEWCFYIYLPPTYDQNSSKLWPTIFLYTPSSMFYNGSGNINDLITANYDNGACAKYLQDSEKSKYPFIADRFIVISPYVDGNMFKCVGGQPQRLGGLHHFLKTAYKIDPAGISLMGLCVGGGTIWNYAESDPTFAACIVPISCNDNWGSTCDLTRACNLKNIWIRHYADAGDPYVPYASAVAVNTALDNCALCTKKRYSYHHACQHARNLAMGKYL